MPIAPSIQWEGFLTAWDRVFADRSWTEVTEGNVAGNFAGKLLELLGWDPTRRPFEVTLNLRVGSAWREVRPDIVLAPPGKDSAKKPGNVYAVIELKRPGLADDDARRQAQCYADYLRAPVYAVIDGERICVWHRRLVDEDVEELNLQRGTFRAEFDKVRKALGRSELETLHTDLKGSTDVVGKAREHAEKVDHNAPSVRLRIEGGNVWASIKREDLLDAKRWWGHPVGTPSPIQLSIAGSYDDLQLIASDLVDAIARVVVHAENVRLAVDEPARWNDELRRVQLHLDHHAADAATRAIERVDPKNATVNLGAPGVLAGEFHAKLDEWAQTAVKSRLNRILSGVEDHNHTHWSDEDVRNALRNVWAVDAAWLKSTLRGSGRDDADARRRLGPRTLPYLVDGVLFPMAVAQVLADLRPGDKPGFPHNLEHANGGTTPSKIGFAYALGVVNQLECDTFLLVLSSSSISPALIRPLRRIGTPSDSARTAWRIGAKSERGLVCCLSDDARTILKTLGWKSFVEHLTSAIRNQHALGGVPCQPPLSMPSLPRSNRDGPEVTVAQ